MVSTEMIKVGVVTIDVSSIGIKFENFMQAGCRDQGSHCVLPKAHYSAQADTLFWKIFRIASTPFHYLWLKYQLSEQKTHQAIV